MVARPASTPGMIRGMAQRRSTAVGEARRPTRVQRPTRLLIVTNMYPTPDRPQTGPFVALRVAALRERGVEVVVAGPTGYGGSSLLRHLRIAWRALTARGHFDGVEAHGCLLYTSDAADDLLCVD